MVQQLNGLWNFPGGTAEAGEAPMCTAWRETLEETGWHAQVQHLLDTMPNGFHLFHCQIDHQQQRRPIDTTEVRSVRWFDRSELREIHWRFPKQSKQVDEWIQRARNLQLAH